MKKVLLLALMGMMAMSTQAQRFTDKLTRGLVAVPQGDKTGQDERYGVSGSGIFVSWRILPTEYYDTKYNLYRDGTKVAENLTVSNYQDNGGSKTSTYRVVPVVKGVEQTAEAAECKPWDHQYWEIPVQNVVNRDGATVSGYTLNDCSVADVDGDGQMEFVVKRRNDSGNLRESSNKTDFNLHECYKMDGSRLWWIDMGPNLMAGADEQFDLILYDWDQDGKAEALMRGADNMIIHTATGKTIKIGNMDYYAPRDEYTCNGAEYLLYMNGETGEPYGWDGSENWTPAAYPLPRFETGESDYGTVWGKSGDGGHRSSKHYFGAPYLDGRNPSIFLGRGAYTRHKFCALDVNKETHELTQRWRWNCYDSSSAWFGNGFHNYAIADVDMDGRDEIVFGSMIIDDTGYGLSTTGFGHGDAQHCSDLDPYRWGLEQFVCLEGATVPGIAYTDATTSTLRYTTGGGSDNGRCMAGNFYNSYPGAVGISGGAISLVSDKAIADLGSFGDDYVNMRVYWDGDLLEEFMDSPGVERAPTVYKAPGQNEVGTNRSYTNSRCWMGQGNLNNSSKNNPCFLGDIIGDWREEIVTRTEDKLIIQISSYPSPWGITSLWYDHVYRNGMTWQSVGYNQPPHTSFFLGEMESITKEPPAITLEGRTEVSGTIGTTNDHLLISGYENKSIAVADGASPYILTVNAPAWVKGSGAQQAIASTPKQPAQTVETYTTTLTGGAFSGATRIIKQGEGVFVLPNVTEKHTGETNIWQGTLMFDGKMESSPVWLNRHTTLISNGGQFMGGLKADYNATIYPGGKGQVGMLTASTLELGFGARIVVDGSNGQFDKVNANSLTIDAKTDDVWKDFGPRYKTPVLQINYTGTLDAGTYELGSIGTVTGDVADLLIEGLGNDAKASLKHEDGKLLLVIEKMRVAGLVTWNGSTDNNIWQQAVSENFLYDGQTSYMASGDDVVFDDNAASSTVVISGAVSPQSVTFNNETKAYTISGDSIVGGGVITKNGNGDLTLNNWNHIGSTVINGGKVTVVMLANNSGQDWGSLGNSSSPITLNDGTTLVTNGTIITDQTLNVSGETTVDVPSGKSVIFNKAIKGSGAIVNKTGAGSLELGTVTNTFTKLVVKAGTVTSNYNSSYTETLPKTVEFQGGTIWGANNESTNINNSTNFVIPQGKTGSFYSGFRSTYTGTLTGAGTFNVYTGGVRAYFNGNWSAFEGTINIGKNNRQNKKSYDPEFLLGNTNGMPKAVVNVNANARLQNQGKSIRVKRFGGTGAIVGTGVWVVDCDEDFTLTTEVGITSARTDDYGNTIAVSASPLTKRGTGKMTMTEGKMNGVLTVENGTVAFYKYKPASLLNGSNNTIVKGSGRLVGQGLLNSLTVQSGGLLIPCGSAVNETSPGTITCNNTVTVNDGATVNFLVNASKNSSLTATNLTFNGTVKLTFSANRELKEGDELKLWTVSGTFSGTPKFELPEAYIWDTSRISEGVLVVTGVSTGIKSQTSNLKSQTFDIYDLKGRLVRRQDLENLPAGIYIRGGKRVMVK
jgi:autotransporter-associated beta strand protein